MNKLLISLFAVFGMLAFEANTPASSHVFENMGDVFFRRSCKKLQTAPKPFNSGFYNKENEPYDGELYGRMKLSPEVAKKFLELLTIQS